MSLFGSCIKRNHNDPKTFFFEALEQSILSVPLPPVSTSPAPQGCEAVAARRGWRSVVSPPCPGIPCGREGNSRGFGWDGIPAFGIQARWIPQPCFGEAGTQGL